MAQGLDINTVMGEAFQKALLKQNETYETYYAKKEAHDKILRAEELKRSGKWTSLEIEYRKEQSRLEKEYYDSLRKEILSERKLTQKLEEDFRREQRVASLNEIDLHNRLEKEYYVSLKKEILEERKEASKKSKEQEKLAEDYWKEQRVASLNEIALEKKYQTYLYKLGLKYEKEREAQVKKQLDQQNKYMNLAFSGVTKTATTAFEGLAQIAVLATASKIDALGSPEVAGILSLFSNEIAQGIIGVIGFAINAWFQKAMFTSLLARAGQTPQAGGLLARAGGAVVGGARGLTTSAMNLGPALFTAFRTVLPILGTAIGEALTAIIATLTSPLVLIVAGIATLVGIGYLVYKNWGWITKTLGNMWKWFQNSILNKDVLLNVFKMTPFGIFLDLIVKGFTTLTDTVKGIKIPEWLGGSPQPEQNILNLDKSSKIKTFASSDILKSSLRTNLLGGYTDFKKDSPQAQETLVKQLIEAKKTLMSKYDDGTGTLFRITGGQSGRTPEDIKKLSNITDPRKLFEIGGHASKAHKLGLAVDIGTIGKTNIAHPGTSLSEYKSPLIQDFVKAMHSKGFYQPYPKEDPVHWELMETKASKKIVSPKIIKPRVIKPPEGRLPDPAVLYKQQQTGAENLPPAPKNLPTLPTLPTITPEKISSADFNLNEINYRLNIVDQMNYGLYPQV